MKRNTFLILSLLLVCGIFSITSVNQSVGNNSGAPAGYTGSPGDGKTCTNCHAGNPTTLNGLITSNVPSSGYIPGSQYTITINLAQQGINKWGFEISPQSITGALRGGLIITNSTETKIVSGKYVTHKAAGTSGSGYKSWSFTWTAPLAGTGDVIFYGAFNYANGNGGSSGDAIRTSTLIIPENLGVGISDVISANNICVFPNPVLNVLSCKLSDKNEKISFTILDINGKTIRTLSASDRNDQCYFFNIEDTHSGIYFLRIESTEATLVKKFVKL